MDAPIVNVRLRSSTRAVLALLLFACAARAQTAFAQAADAFVSTPLTLEQALQLAEARSESIGAARAGVARADGDIIRARSGLFPQLSAFASYDRALASEFEGLFDRSQRPACEPLRDLQVARTRIALLPELPLSDNGGLRAPVQTQRPRPPFTAPTPAPPQQPTGGAGQLRNATAQQPRTPTGGRQ